MADLIESTGAILDFLCLQRQCINVTTLGRVNSTNQQQRTTAQSDQTEQNLWMSSWNRDKNLQKAKVPILFGPSGEHTEE